jgi:hypothetical protein
MRIFMSFVIRAALMPASEGISKSRQDRQLRVSGNFLSEFDLTC